MQSVKKRHSRAVQCCPSLHALEYSFGEALQIVSKMLLSALLQAGEGSLQLHVLIDDVYIKPVLELYTLF